MCTQMCVQYCCKMSTLFMCNNSVQCVLKFVCNNPVNFVLKLMRNINGKCELEFMYNVTVNISIQNQSLHISEEGMLNTEHKTTK